MVAPPNRERIAVELPPQASKAQQHQLRAFVRHCVQRIEMELGPHERWAIRIEIKSASGYTSIVEVHHLGVMLGTTGNGSDGEVATWEAMCRVEQLLRERRG